MYENHSKFMAEAVALSLRNVREGMGGPFGAVIVKDGEILARGTNQVTVINDPTAHAEVVAIRAACKALTNFQLHGCEIYSSCEPCPMCLSAIYWAHLDRVYFASSREDAALAGFDDSLIYAEVAKPLDCRKIPIQQLRDGDAKLAFAEWEKSPLKIHY